VICISQVFGEPIGKGTSSRLQLGAHSEHESTPDRVVLVEVSLLGPVTAGRIRNDGWLAIQQVVHVTEQLQVDGMAVDQGVLEAAVQVPDGRAARVAGGSAVGLLSIRGDILAPVYGGGGA
jgi:hypothetical protein